MNHRWLSSGRLGFLSVSLTALGLVMVAGLWMSSKLAGLPELPVMRWIISAAVALVICGNLVGLVTMFHRDKK